MKSILNIFLLGSMLIWSCDSDEVSNDQTGHFVKFYTNFPEFIAADVSPTENGFAVLGTAKTIEGETWMALLRTNKFGNSIDSVRLYGITGPQGAGNIAYRIRSLSDGGFAILGSVINPSTGFRSAYFVRTDAAGDTLWTTTISQNGDLEAKYFDVSVDGNFFLTGYYNSPDQRKQIWWFGLDNQGNGIRNQREAGLDGDDEGTHLQILPDGRLIITGYVTQGASKRAIIIRTNSSTIHVTSFIPDPEVNGDYETGNSLYTLNEDEFYLLCTAGNASSSRMSLKHIYFPETTNGSILWTKNYGSGSVESGRSMLSNGQSIYILGTTTITGSNTAITLTETDLSGTEISRREFGSGSRLSASAFEQTDDGGFIILGTSIHPPVNNTSVALIKTR